LLLLALCHGRSLLSNCQLDVISFPCACGLLSSGLVVVVVQKIQRDVNCLADKSKMTR
jgi:hypothetical protein